MYVPIKVTMEVTYLVPRYKDSKFTVINGWTPEEVVKDWFGRHDINRYHATRDMYVLGGTGKKVVGVEILPDI